MPTPSEHTRLSLEARLGVHARATWPQLEQLHVRHCGAFAYVEAELADRERVKLMRLRYTGAVGTWPDTSHSTASDDNPRRTYGADHLVLQRCLP
ncbi:hypothetical protein DY245_06475 [Streptomyces inhibens]|uniref:Uncharacterized protein n=1 Tax=Streptomyces inhibens TaxID=2293571 RepID=A0A371Q9G9_STRIH|nr:hypothetical protein [Streptomyces inhibens]REK91093.1 hypothetical protein DY245_06475 [Streptomyces inhibens]